MTAKLVDDVDGYLAGGKCYGGPYADQYRSHFRSKMPVLQELVGYIGEYVWINGGWRWSPLTLR